MRHTGAPHHAERGYITTDERQQSENRGPDPVHPAKIRRHLVWFDPLKAEALVKRFAALFAHQKQDAILALEQCANDVAADAQPLPLWNNRDRGKLTAAIAMRLHLSHAHDACAFGDNYEARPIEAERIQLCAADNCSDRLLVVRGSRSQHTLRLDGGGWRVGSFSKHGYF